MIRDPNLLPFIEAWLKGEKVQTKAQKTGIWVNVSEAETWDKSPQYYRIKPPLLPLSLEQLEQLVGETVQQHNGGRYLVVAAYTHVSWGKGEPAVSLGGVQGAVTAVELLQNYLSLDGSPLGRAECP